MSALMSLCEKADNDIRSCLNTLQVYCCRVVSCAVWSYFLASVSLFTSRVGLLPFVLFATFTLDKRMHIRVCLSCGKMFLGYQRTRGIQFNGHMSASTIVMCLTVADLINLP